MSPNPTLTIAIQPETRVRLEALSTLLQQPLGKVVEKGIQSLLGTLSENDRGAIEVLSKRAMQNLQTLHPEHGKPADDIRQYILKRYIEPARRKSERQVRIRAGEVHSAMRLTNRMPAVTSVLGSNMFEAAGRLRRLSIEGPANGARATFTFELLS